MSTGDEVEEFLPVELTDPVPDWLVAELQAPSGAQEGGGAPADRGAGGNVAQESPWEARAPWTTVAMDPPWKEVGGGGRGAQNHYQLLSTPEILQVIMRKSPLLDAGPPKDCALWMWATNNHLPDALWVMEALGATYVTNVVWVKQGRLGLGQHFRGGHELLLFGRWGHVACPEPAHRKPSWFGAARGRHSAKPDEAVRLMENHDQGITGLPGVGTVEREARRLELFARNKRPGWTTWGLEAGNE